MTDRDAVDSSTGPEAFFEGSGVGLEVYRRVREIVPNAEIRVTKSQIAFRRRRAFAWLWRPRMYLGRRGAEVVLSVALPREDPSPRWKEVLRPSPRAWLHHLELSSAADIDAQVRSWLVEAQGAAAAPSAGG